MNISLRDIQQKMSGHKNIYQKLTWLNLGAIELLDAKFIKDAKKAFKEVVEDRIKNIEQLIKEKK